MVQEYTEIFSFCSCSNNVATWIDAGNVAPLKLIIFCSYIQGIKDRTMQFFVCFCQFCLFSLEISCYPAQTQDTQCHMQQSSHRTEVSLLHVSLSVQCSFLSMVICGHAADVTGQKAQVLFHPSIRPSSVQKTFSQKLCGFVSISILANSSLAFL